MASVTHSTAWQDETVQAASRKSRRFGWPMRLIFGFALFVLLIGLLPTIVANTPLLDMVLSKAISPEQGRVSAQSVSLGWFSPIAADGLEVHDADGNLLISVTSFSVDKTLLAVATDQSDLGTLHINQPEVHLKTRADGSNLEDFLAPWLQPSEDASQPISVAVQVVDGKILLEDAVSGRSWQIDGVNTNLAMAASGSPAIKADASAKIISGVQPATLNAKFEMGSAEDSSAAGLARIKSSALPVHLFQSVLARFVPDLKVVGSLTSDLQCSWGVDGKPEKIAVQGTATFEKLHATGAMLGSDHFQLQRVHIPCKLEIEGQRLKAHPVALQCDVGELQVEGEVDLAALNTGQEVAALAKQSLSASGRLDIARLATLLPETLHIRQGTRITSGQIQFNLNSSAGEQSQAWKGQAELSGLTAINQGQTVSWQQPIQLTGQARMLQQGIYVDSLSCQSDFLQVTASGTPDKLQGSANFDLQQLTHQLQQFVDLGGWSFAGTGQGEVNWTRTAQGRFDALATLGVKDFQLSVPEQKPWTDSQLDLQVEAAGNLQGTTPKSLEKAVIGITAGEDRAKLQLTEVVSNPSADSTWPLDMKLQGSLARWLARVSPWVALDDLKINGVCDLAAQARCNTKLVDIEQSSLAINQLDFAGYGLNIQEPKVELRGGGRYDLQSGALSLPNTTLATSAVSLRAEKVSVELLEAEAPKLSGNVALQGSLKKLYRWLQDPEQPSEMGIEGDIAGDISLVQQGSQTKVQFDLLGNRVEITQHVVDSKTRTMRIDSLWREPKLAMVGRAAYDQSTDQLQIQQIDATSETLKLAAAGAVKKLTSEQDLDLKGNVQYDLAELAPLLRSYLGARVQLAGRETAPFQIQGPLTDITATDDKPGVHWSRRLKAQLSLGWQEGRVYGLNVGQAKINSQLEAGLLRTSPLDISVSEGKLKGAPVVRFDPEPAELFLSKGPLLSQVRISPEVSDAALKYVAPVLAQATRTDGRFSLDLEGGRIPLGTPEQADIAGKLTVHNVNVMPGPLAQQFILIGKQVEAIRRRQPPPVSLKGSQQALLKIENQAIPFRMVQGRVYHERLSVVSGDVVIYTHGSVGLDQTLALVADIPVQDKWLQGDPLLQSLRGQTIRVNIGGTFTSPKLDGRGIQQLAARLIRGAAQETISRELGNQLDKLFGPKR